MRNSRQTSLGSAVTIMGSGVHSNAPARIVLHPASANAGITFLRTGLPGCKERVIEARWSEVSMTELCTVIGRHDGATVSTVEHLLAALAGLGVDNAMIEIDGPEVPIMDGSSVDFVEAIEQAGIVQLAASRRYIKILKPVRVENGRAFSELRPADQGFRLEVEIDFAAGVIGRQKVALDLTAESFRRELSRARTFGFIRDVERLWKAGFALGASLDNTVALDGERVLNPGGLRFGDEFARHKALDAVGDLSLAGAPLIGCYRSFCSGHKMNVAVLEELFADRKAYAIIEAGPRRPAVSVGSYFEPQPAYASELN